MQLIPESGNSADASDHASAATAGAERPRRVVVAHTAGRRVVADASPVFCERCGEELFAVTGLKLEGTETLGIELALKPGLWFEDFVEGESQRKFYRQGPKCRFVVPCYPSAPVMEVKQCFVAVTMPSTFFKPAA